MTIANVYVEPGVYSQFKPSTTLPVAPGGLRVAALVGAGRLTNIVSAETVTRGGTVNTSDSLANVATALSSTIVDEDYNNYRLGMDYQLTAGAVDWNLLEASVTGTEVGPFASLNGLTLILSLNGATQQTVTFGALTDVDAVVLAINTALGSSVATVVEDPLEAVAVNITNVDVDTVTLTLTDATAVVVGRKIVQGAFTQVVLTKVGNDITVASNVGYVNGAASVKAYAVNLAISVGDILINNGTANTILGFTDGAVIAGGKEPATGKTYTVSYEYAKVSADYVPKFYYNMDDVVADFGDVTTTNTLSLGAEIVFQHGASVVCLAQCDPVDGALVQQFRKAIDKLLSVAGINIVVALSTNTTLFSYLKTHVDTASSLTERKERTAIVGMAGSPTLSTIMGYATSLDSKRMVIVHPTRATRYVGTDTVVSTLDGAYLAAAVAGIRTSVAYDVAEPLTKKEIVGFEAIPDTLLRAEKNQLAASGVLVIENVGGISRVRHGITTDVGTIDAREYSVVETIDFVGSSMRQLLETIFIGQKILADTPSQVRSTVSAILSNLITTQIIIAFDNVTASINGTDPTQIDVSFRISPVFPLNYILISFSLSL